MTTLVFEMADINKLIEEIRTAKTFSVTADQIWIGPYISIHFLSLNPLLARCRRYSRGER